jgi:hypothetical protein
MPTGNPEQAQPVKKDNTGNTGNTGNRKNVTQLQSTPFKSQSEGDAFRAWVRQTDATYASQIQLDATGPFNNNTIRTAYQKYGKQYNPSSGTVGGDDEYGEIKKNYPKINLYNRLFIFLTNNGKFSLNTEDANFGDILVKTNDKNMYLGYNLPTAFIKAVVEKYPQITKVSVPEKIGNNKVELQLEFFTRIKGLQTILEQQQTPIGYITYNIVDGKIRAIDALSKAKDVNYKTRDYIVTNNDIIQKDEKSETVSRVKKMINYVDSDPNNKTLMTDDFINVLKEWRKNNLQDENSVIDSKLICNLFPTTIGCQITN